MHDPDLVSDIAGPMAACTLVLFQVSPLIATKDESSLRVPWPRVEPGPLASDAKLLPLCHLHLFKTKQFY